MAAAWRCCAATEAVAAPCDGHGRSSACVAEEEDWITAYVRGTIVMKMAFVARREASACVAGDKEDGADRRQCAKVGSVHGRVRAHGVFF